MDKDEFRKWRKSLGWTQVEAGEELGVTRETVIRWENQGPCRNERLVELACRQLKSDMQFAHFEANEVYTITGPAQPPEG